MGIVLITHIHFLKWTEEPAWTAASATSTMAILTSVWQQSCLGFKSKSGIYAAWHVHVPWIHTKP